MRFAFLLLVAWPFGLAAQAFPPPLTSQEVAQVRERLAAFRVDPRGPYLRIRWFCADGTTAAPVTGTAVNPCVERGGGVQHAEFKPEAVALGRLGFHPGTLLQAITFEQLLDAERGNSWLRELPLQQFLFEVDNGWVLERAQYYRGARQIEDEEAKGKEILERLLADPGWTRSHYLLAIQSVATIAHPGSSGDRSTQRIRNLATEIAVLDNRFFEVRIKIHSFPSETDLIAVREFSARSGLNAEARSRLGELQELLEAQYDPAVGGQRVTSFARRVPRAFRQPFDQLAPGVGASEPDSALAAAGALLRAIRDHVTTSRDGRGNLVLLDLALTVQERAFTLAQATAAGDAPTRDQGLRRLMALADVAQGAGFLSGREGEALRTAVAELRAAPALTALEYRSALAYLARALDWGWGTARATFGPVQERYQAVEPKAAGFLDALVRGSALLQLSLHIDALVTDADLVLEAPHRLLGRNVTSGARGLNPGLALRPLEVADLHDLESAQSDRIYVIPATTPELRPVAGVLTLDEGNLLSHVQLLARNLGIPNAVVSSAYLDQLRRVSGQDVLFAVSPLGRVFLERPDQVQGPERALIDATRVEPPPRLRLDTSRLHLDRWQPVPLDSLRASISGVLVGPKAANLGELAYAFPDHVSRGVALPFGMFARHVDRPFEGSETTVLQALREAYTTAATMTAGGASEAEVDGYMFERLAWVRRAIEALPWQPDVQEAIAAAVRTTFGGEPTGGVFVRSDTNVEDLPQFSGAGLNLTVAHRRSVDDILSSVKRVWTSPFSERAYLWRKQILEEQGSVYPSVLLLESIHSDRSGVLITSGLQYGPDSLTVVTAEGVGGAVDGEEAETVVLPRNATGGLLLTQAKAPRRRALVDRGAGGTEWRVAALPDTLLGESDLEQLRSVVREWERRLPPEQHDEVWDMEFGFEGGKLWLFQIRPFVRFRSSELMGTLSLLDRQALENGSRPVDLSAPVQRLPVLERDGLMRELSR
ncbi:MAG: PEP/pyruvate-binding domain-containing protein [Gemmatimonadota bacterium]